MLHPWTNTTHSSVMLGGREQPVANSWLEWQVPHQHSEEMLRADFSILSGLISAEEAHAMTSLLTELEFDSDADTVDGMTSHEFYLERYGGHQPEHFSSLTEKPDAHEEYRRKRAPVRSALADITKPIVEDRITPWVRMQYGDQCARGGGRDCTPCFSIVRRYLPGERRAHAMHFDIQAAVDHTSVVSSDSV